MYVGHRMKKIIIALFIIGSLVALALLLSRGGSNLCPHVTIKNIKRVQLGMTKQEVISILGEPYSVGPGIYGCNTLEMTYSQPVKFARWYPMLWVHLRSNVVMEVYGKRYVDWGLDDVGVYSLSLNQKQWEAQDLDSTFPKD